MTVTQARWLAVPSSEADPTWPRRVALFLAGVAGLDLAHSRRLATLLNRPLVVTRADRGADAAASPRRGLSLDLPDEF